MTDQSDFLGAKHRIFEESGGKSVEKGAKMGKLSPFSPVLFSEAWECHSQATGSLLSGIGFFKHLPL